MEDWRAFEGEKAHMLADRTRMDELMAEERDVWDRERKYLFSRINELETQLESVKSAHATSSPQVLFSSRVPGSKVHNSSLTSEGSHARSATGSADSNARSIPQESGRNADGTPFYAPAPRNPSRTFSSSSENAELRVDDISAPRETPICVTSKVLKPVDFLQSPPGTTELSSIPETPVDTIDISQIQPNLEGIHIKASAVNPSFVAQVISPGYTPSTLSPSVKAPSRIPAQVDGITSPPNRKSASPEEKAADKVRKTLQVAAEPEHGRLTIHAGHTPSHSITKLNEYFGTVDGTIAELDEDTTPKQNPADRSHRPSIAPGILLGGDDVGDSNHDEEHDKPLTGPLGLTNHAAADNSFLQQLHSKLEEAKRSEGNSPISESGSSITSETRSTRPSRSMRDDQDDKGDDGPVLRLKPSLNFGRPMGRF
jgi:hypothetical protein